jgi:hypothetical protein
LPHPHPQFAMAIAERTLAMRFPNIAVPIGRGAGQGAASRRSGCGQGVANPVGALPQTPPGRVYLNRHPSGYRCCSHHALGAPP